ncbi:hypothetical protein G314FT_16000 [Vagococcus luciliae]|uniref:Uncharacterized protein n=1 Tax=Vagococcus luciliae TaxID=2920380 RepID=A0ABY5P0I8_9ENTE|nr:hypothetical protein G314FT_16000 [Vagococcus luciliae]
MKQMDIQSFNYQINPSFELMIESLLNQWQQNY